MPKTDMQKKIRTSMEYSIVIAIMVLLAIFGIVSSIIGYITVSDTFTKEYSTSTYHMADTAATVIVGDNLHSYLEGENQDEYRRTRKQLNSFCKKLNVSMIYVLEVDTSDYGRFVSIFNPVNNSVDNSSYVEWELGHKRDTTNNEYRQKYRNLYEGTSKYETVFRTKPTDGQHPHVTTMVPILNSDDETVGILCMQRPISELQEQLRPYLVKIGISTIILAVFASFFAASYFRKQIVAPIRKVSDEATRFARENTKGDSLSNISHYEEISSLSEAIEKMESEMLSYISNLTKITAEKERIGTEMKLANEIQYTSLPHVFPPFPDRNEFDIYAVMDPAREVGGDFYDFFLIDDDHLCVTIADVSGKGVPGALFMMISKIIIQNCAMMGKPVGEILELTNDALCANNQVEMFVTVWIGILEISTGRLVAANAGHEYPVFKMPGGSYELYKDKHSFVIGGIEDLNYMEYEMQLKPGTKIFVYTDGVPEATNANNQMFGIDRMLDALNEDKDADPKCLLMNVRRAVDDFVQDAEPFDDLTMLCVEYNGSQTV